MSKEKKISRKDIIGLCEFLKIHHFENAYTLFEYTEGLEQKVEQLENIIKEAIEFCKKYDFILKWQMLDILNKGSESNETN